MERTKNDIIERNDTDESRIAPDDVTIRSLLEAVLFLSNEPVPSSFFVKNFALDPTQAKILLDSLVDEYAERDGGIRLEEIAKGYQFVTNPRHAEQLRRVMGIRKREGLSKGMLETLAIIAYKQPVVLAEIDELRGVSSRMSVVRLVERKLVKPVGRKELPGRPLAYGTTNEFLRHFGLRRLSDLPKLSEIKEFSMNWDDEHDA
jgi:segregation and condensation protein B